MEKRKPTYNLESIQEVFSKPSRLSVTGVALRDAIALGCDREMMVEIIQSIERQDFYKSMTSYADTTLWQDVYHVSWEEMVLYIKFTADVVTEFRLLSFKEK